MILLDVNVLVAAFRADHPQHGSVRPWWDTTLDGNEPIVVPELVLVGFVRVVTSPRVFVEPSPSELVDDFVEALSTHPLVTVVGGLPAALRIFRDICRTEGATGNLVTDAWIAAQARALGAGIATLDRDFRRFDGLRLVTPVGAGS